MKENAQVILGVCGGIAAYKACDIIRRLQENKREVTVVMTKSSEEFITPLTLETLSGKKAYTGLFDKRENLAHISLSKLADVLLIAPATANIIGKIANGIADDLLTCIAMTTRAKIIIVPAMNSQMYNNKIVQENCEKLKKFGIQFVQPIEGNLACGDEGPGHIAEIDDIVKAAIA